MRPLFACVLTAALLVATSAAQAAELKVLSGNGPRAAVRELCAQFERSTGHKIVLRFGVNPEVKQKIEAGETFDVVVGNPPIVDALIKDRLVVGPRVDIGRAGLGVAVRSGAAKQPQAAKALIAFLSAPGAAATLKAKGVEPH